ncbi:hypothetical protein F4679DRAFT_579978 [Xylaria curta]|nr:hypothetical protein F4679DRAFT_579978 [Xylaria curta]
MIFAIVFVVVAKVDTCFRPLTSRGSTRDGGPLFILSLGTLYYECVLTSAFRTAPNALNNLKAKFKAVFKKKDKKPKEGASTSGTTEAAKVDTPAAATAGTATLVLAPTPGKEAPATEAAKPVTETTTGAATEAKPETPVAAADTTSEAPAAPVVAEAGAATDTKPAGTA